MAEQVMCHDRPLMQTVAQNVCVARLHLGESISTVARRSGISKGYWAKVERGESGDIGVCTLWRMARALGVQPSDLVRPSAGIQVGSSRSFEEVYRAQSAAVERDTLGSLLAAGEVESERQAKFWITETNIAIRRAEAAEAEVERLRTLDDFAELIADGHAAAKRAMVKFPQPNYVITKIAEEAGEVVKAAVHCAEGRETFANLRGEMVQVIAMLYRLWVEGDEVHGLPAVRAALAAPTMEATDG